MSTFRGPLADAFWPHARPRKRVHMHQNRCQMLQNAQENLQKNVEDVCLTYPLVN
jgi:hypothetical protein